MRLLLLDAATLLLLLMLPPWEGAQGQMSDEDFDMAWYNTEELPQVDLEGLVRNLTKQITWFKYVGRKTMFCANQARQQDTLMLAIERLHDCLQDAYQECASEFANQTGCASRPVEHFKACGHMRLGYQGNVPVYENNLECRWFLKVPDEGLFVMNLTIDELYMESSGLDCVYDYMMIYDGYSETNRSWGRHCGRIPRFTIYGSTNRMMITAVTDSSIGKYGFRAVYQVMDKGHGRNYEEPPIYKDPQGTFSLANSDTTIFELYWQAFYYTKWFIRADFGQVIEIDLEFVAGNHASVFVFNGPSAENEILLGLNYTEIDIWGLPVSMVGDTQRNSTVTTSFNAMLMVQRKSLNDSTQLNVLWFMRELQLHEMYHIGDCTGSSNQQLGGNWTATIGVGSSATLNGGMPIQCFWHIKTKPGDFIQVDIKKFNLNASDYDRCMYEGLLVMNGPSLDDGVQRIGPFCYDEPLGIFTSKGVNQITSSDQDMLIMFYSFLEYPSMVAGDTIRGVFEAQIKSTPCQGLLQVCEPPQSIITTPNYRSESIVTNTSVDVTFSCDKSKCCRLQQFPTYGLSTYRHCSVSVKRQGKKLLATSEFRTDLVAANKRNQQMKYSCQRRERLRIQEANDTRTFGGAHSYRCLGTEVHLTYFSTSIWSMPAFTVQVQENKCGYYRPDRHVENEFYPPCVVAQFPVKRNKFPIRYFDPFFKEGRYFNFLVKYRNTDYSGLPTVCPEECSLHDLLHIIGRYDAYAWSSLPDLPFRWRSWGRAEQTGNWSRELVVQRQQGIYADCPYVPGCEINVEFFGSTMNKVLLPGTGNITCPEGYSHLGRGCYMLIWPSDADSDVLNDTAKLSWEGARRMCQQHGGDLITVNTGDEIKPILNKIYYDWWQLYLQRVPGIKFLHIGLRWSHQTLDERWVTLEPLTYSNWAVPDYKKRRPDLTSFPGKPDELVDTVRSKALQNSLNFLQPWNIKGYDCTVMMVISFHEPATWVRVPCDEEIPGSLPLCESKVETPPTVPMTMVETPENYQTRVVSRNGDDTLLLSHYNCQPPFSLVGTRCMFLNYQASYVKKIRPDVGCQTTTYGKAEPVQVPGKPALFDDDLLSLMNETLPYWRQDMHTGNIRIHYSGSKSVGVDGPECYALTMTPLYEGPNGTNARATWVLTPLWQCEAVQDENGGQTLLPPHDELQSFICETEPTRINETCGQDQYQCSDGTCVLLHHQCDGYRDCYDGGDEHHCDHVCQWSEDVATPGDCYSECSSNNCTCHHFYFQCASGGCVPASKICDLHPDCLDGSDEAVCNHFPCNTRQVKCGDLSCIGKERQCDFKVDCPDGSDEDPEICHFDKCTSTREDYFKCSSGRCIPKAQKDDLIPDCLEDRMMDEDGQHLAVYRNALVDQTDGSLVLNRARCSGYELNCNMYFRSKCYDMHQSCVYDDDKYGNMAYCRTGSHLEHCEARSCGIMFKCPNSYCLPTRKLCNGINDCPFGEDEANCRNFQCPGMFRCKGETNCLLQSQVCDKVVDCKHSRDDEALCSYRHVGCPEMCECFGNAVSCADKGLEVIPPIQEGSSSMTPGAILSVVRILILRNNKLKDPLPPTVTNELTQLHRFDLSNNEISNPGEGAFELMTMLVELYLHNNQLGSLTREYFSGLTNLKVLTLYGNSISHVMRDAFKGLDSLPVMDLGGQELRTLDDSLFAGLKSLRSLNLSYNLIDSINNKTFTTADGEGKLTTLRYLNIKGNNLDKAEPFAFRYLPDEMFLESDQFKYCCFARHIEKCVPGPDEFSSCDNLIANPGLRVAVWAIGLLAFLGNLVILQQRMKHEKDTGTSLLVQHLSFADFMMGVYVLIIAGSDQYHKGNYIYEADGWRDHALCKLAGFLSMLSCEMSSFCIMLITMDRLYGCFPGCGKGKGMGARGARGFIALGWTVCAILSIVPILEFGYFGSSSYVRGGVCTLYNVVKGREMSGWEYSMALFVVINFLLYAASGLGYICVYRGMMKGIDAWELPEEMTEEEKEAEREFRRNEFLLGRRLVLVVATNFIVWMPLVAVGAMALAGHHVDKTTSAWIAMFVVPLNSALNPFMYSFTTKPYRIPRDDLLANWHGDDIEDEEDEDEDGEGRGETEMGDSSVAATARDNKAVAREAVLREML